MAGEPGRRPAIHVLAGTNGAGKSSIGGAMIRESGADYHDPDEAARRILAADPGLDQRTANAEAWAQGRRLLERAIVEGLDFAFETTLGGETMTRLLEVAADAGHEVHVWYVGLEGPEMHLARVRARVARGGHDILEEKIRERYDRSRANLIRLLPRLSELLVYDNSDAGDPALGVAPRPRFILHLIEGSIVDRCELTEVPDWAKPIVMAALRIHSAGE